MKIIKVLLSLYFVANVALAQTHHVVSGYITDNTTGEVLIGANIYDVQSKMGTQSNGYGYYSLTLPQGTRTLICSFLGYENDTVPVHLYDNCTLFIGLKKKSINLNDITIQSNFFDRTDTNNEYPHAKLTAMSIQKLPNLFGEPDLIKAIQLQSGVKSLGEGSSGIFVRGGSNDQNLILIDEAPIYNPSHMFGLISVFNSDALNHVSFYKSNMPAHYGGRVSSVIDCKLKEGNANDFDFSFGINPLALSVSANGPIVKGKSTFFVAARKSLIDQFFNVGTIFPIVPGFHDLNLKLKTNIGDKNKLFLSFYNGKDLLNSDNNYQNIWGNTTGTLRWNRSIGSKIFMNTSIILSRYWNEMNFSETSQNYKWRTGLKDSNLKLNIAYYIRPEKKIELGFGSIYHQFIPGETDDSSKSISRIQAFENSAYFAIDEHINSTWGINYGVYISVFQNTGTGSWFDFDQNFKAIAKYSNEKGIYKTYASIEPRISISYRPHITTLVKASYARNSQNLQVLQNNTLSYSALETWFPANPNIKPIISDAFSIGWFKKHSQVFSFSSEIYYKYLKNQIDYVDHALLVNNPTLLTEIRTGIAHAFGLELSAKKNTGKMTGELSYTFSRSFRKIKGINSDNWYNSPYDIPHDFRIQSNYQLSQRWDLSSIWVLNSGRPITLPIGYYMYNQHVVPIYAKRNSNRFPIYHRLDIAFNYSWKSHKQKCDWRLTLGAYNAYLRSNPIGYKFDYDVVTNRIVAYKYTLFSISPNIALKVNF